MPCQRPESGLWLAHKALHQVRLVSSAGKVTVGRVLAGQVWRAEVRQTNHQSGQNLPVAGMRLQQSLRQLGEPVYVDFLSVTRQVPLENRTNTRLEARSNDVAAETLLYYQCMHFSHEGETFLRHLRSAAMVWSPCCASCKFPSDTSSQAYPILCLVSRRPATSGSACTCEAASTTSARPRMLNRHCHSQHTGPLLFCNISSHLAAGP